VTRPSEIHGVETAALVGRLREVLDGELHSLVEFDRDAFNPLFLHDSTLELYPDEERMLEHFDRIHRYVNLDLMEMSLFIDDIVPQADHVRSISTMLDVGQMIRVYVDDRGFFLAVGPDESIPPLVAAIEEVVRD
jgi:hypothetical protein